MLTSGDRPGSGGASVTDLPRVGIWRRDLLPPSETFIRNQMSALRRWRPVLFGERRLPLGLPVSPEFVLEDHLRWPTPGNRAFVLLRRSRPLARFVRRSQLRLVHAHFGPSAAGVLPTVRAAGVPLLVTFHGFDVTRRPSRRDLRDRLYSARLVEVFAYATKLVAVSDFIADELVAKGCPREKIVTLYTGVPDPGAPPATTVRRGILFVGRLVEKKGLGTLLEAVAALPEPYRSTPVTVVGDGPLRGQAEAAAARHGLWAVFAGHRTPEDVTELMRGHEVLCVPSQRAADGDAEGFGMVFLEAAMNGLPVVSTRHGGIGEAVEDGCSGLLVQPDCPTDLAAALLRVLSDAGLAADLGARGRGRAVRHFTIDRQTRALEDVYSEVVETHARSPQRAHRPWCTPR